MYSVAKEDIEALKKKRVRLIFIIGGPGSGKGTQCQKLVSEFKFIHISTGELLRKEIQKHSKLGKDCEAFYLKGEFVPIELVISVLLKEIVESKGENFLIDGYPRSLEQAFFFEKNIREVKLVLNIIASEETCLTRIMERGQKEGRRDDTLEAGKNRIAKFKKESQPVIDFYSRYGLVRNIDSEKSIGAVFESVKQNLYPVIYSIIGKRYSGKTTLSKMLSRRVGMKRLDFGKFLESPDIAKRKNESDFVVSSLIAKLRDEESIRVLIEDFPQNKEQYNYFVNNCKGFQRIFYLNADNTVCLERNRSLEISDRNYIECEELNKLLYDFEQKKDFLDFLRKKANILEIDVNNYQELTVQKFIDKIQPYIIIVNCAHGCEEKRVEFINKLVEVHKFEIVDSNQAINGNINRQTPIGKDMRQHHMKKRPADHVTDILRPIIFKETMSKFILFGFPHTLYDLSVFEENICEVNKLIYIADPSSDVLSSLKHDSIEMHFKKEHKLQVIKASCVNDYAIQECLGMTRDINIVYGMPLSGKKTISKHLESKYNFKLLDFKDLINDLKKKKMDPDSNDDPEITFPELLQGLQDKLKSLNPKQRILVQNLFIPQEFLIDSVEKAEMVIKTFGTFRRLYQLKCEEMVLIDRYKQVQQITEDLTDEQKIQFQETLEKPKAILNMITQHSNQIIEVNTNNSVVRSQMLFDYMQGWNYIVIKHEYDIHLEKVLSVFATKNKVLYVNVPKLIYQHFYENENYAEKLENTYGKKKLIDEISDPTEGTRDQWIYYKYNPIHFDTQLVNEIIFDYVTANYREIEDSGNFIILTGYLNYDLVTERDFPFHLPLIEIKQLLDLGELTAFIQITSDDIKTIEDEIPEKIIIEKPQKVVPQDPLLLDAEGNPEQQPPQEEPVPDPDEEVPKFKPEDYEWTSYDGIPRNYVQILSRLKRLPIESKTSSSEEIETCVADLLTCHIDNYRKRKETRYPGVIDLVKIT